MKQGWLILFIIFQLSISSFAATQFITCNSTYALCTTAQCNPFQDNKRAVCYCDVKTGYSTGQKDCRPVKDSLRGKIIYSRYFPIKSYMICSNNRPWAWCLDKPCYIDQKDPSKAFCFCTLVQNLGDYIYVTDSYNPNACTTGVISSATVQQSNEITNYLQMQPSLRPFPIKVITGPNPVHY